MSTYLVCFVISEFQSSPNVDNEIENQDGTKFPLLTWSQPDLLLHTEEAFTAAKMSLEYYIKEYFKINYALDKLGTLFFLQYLLSV
jgi:aminopeptidase N